MKKQTNSKLGLSFFTKNKQSNINGAVCIVDATQTHVYLYTKQEKDGLKKHLKAKRIKYCFNGELAASFLELVELELTGLLLDHRVSEPKLVHVQVRNSSRKRSLDRLQFVLWQKCQLDDLLQLLLSAYYDSFIRENQYILRDME